MWFRPPHRLACCVVAASLLVTIPCRAEPAAADAVATVDEVPILRADRDALLSRFNATGAPVPAGGIEGGDARQRLEAVALQQLIDERLLRGEVKRLGITATDAEVEARLDLLKREVAARAMTWEDFLARSGRDEAALWNQIALEVGVAKLVEPRTSGAALEAAYQQRRRELDGTRLRVSHILLRPDLAFGAEALPRLLDRAAAIRREILQGLMSFGEAARRHSVAPSRARGGDLGWISRQGPFGEVFSREAFGLAKGDLSRPFVTPSGVHIVQVSDVEPGRLDFAALRPTLEQLLAAEAIRDTLSKLRAAVAIDYAAGVPHFDPAQAETEQPRRVIVKAAPATQPRPAAPAAP
jgi:parvulin-like peptidyl-prolyl isomerase